MEVPQGARLYTRRLKEYGTRKAVLTLGTLLSHASDASIIRMTQVLERLAGKDYYRQAIRDIRGHFLEGHPSLAWVLRIIRELDPVYRDRLVENLVLNHLVFGTKKRQHCLEEHGVYPPSAVLFSPLMDCNLRCIGCYSATYRREGQLSLEVLDRVLTEMKEVGTHLVFISGGEPFLRPDLLELYSRHSDCLFGVFTNGTLLDEPTCARILELGNVVPFISVEGLEQETDARRGGGHFQTILQAMGMLRRGRALFGFSVTATRLNADLVAQESFVDFYMEQGCLLGWYLNYVPVGRKPEVDLMPLPQQRLNLREAVKRIRATRPIGVIDFWNDGHLVGGCISAGRKYLHINHRGDVEPCAFVHFSDVNIHGRSFIDALGSPYLRAIRQRQPFDPHYMRPCQIIDRPEVLRECVRAVGARASDGSSSRLLGDLAVPLDGYSRAYAEIADPIWNREQRESARRPPEERGSPAEEGRTEEAVG